MVQNLAVDCLLGTSLIDHHVEAILPGLRKAVFYHSSSVAITCQRSLIKPKASFTLELERKSRIIQTTRKITTPPVSQPKVQAQCPTGKLCSVHNIPRLATKHLTLMANGIMNIFPHKPFNRLLSNYSSRPVHLETTVIGHDLEAPERTFTVDALKLHLL